MGEMWFIWLDKGRTSFGEMLRTLAYERRIRQSILSNPRADDVVVVFRLKLINGAFEEDIASCLVQWTGLSHPIHVCLGQVGYILRGNWNTHFCEMSYSPKVGDIHFEYGCASFEDGHEKKRSIMASVKVRWDLKRGPELTWERKDQMRSKCPQLFVDSANALSS
ncbi:hypothetical protein Tco_0857340 [Tanacetum coccineum]|uniref:Uncharacterized protein n=1 Tax=Tanacetum coccineum TaxID=301880 RepID=A0ABQ5B721_9ASTR